MEAVVAAPERFRAFIGHALNHALQRLPTATEGLDQEGRAFAFHALGYGLRYAPVWPETRALLLALALPLEQAGYRHEWIPYLEQGVAQAARLDDPTTEAELSFHLGVIYHHQGRLNEARLIFQRALALNKAHGDGWQQGRIMNRLAQTARSEGCLEEASLLLGETLTLIGDEVGERGFSHMVLGTIAFDSEQWEDCESHFRRSLTYWEQSGDMRRIAFGLTNLSTVLAKQGQFTESRGLHERTVVIFKTIGDPVHQAVATMNLGNVVLAQQEYEDAAILYAAASQHLLASQDQIRLAPLLNNQGMVLHKLQRWDEARRSYEASLKYWEHLGNRSKYVNTLDNLGLLFLERQDFCQAVEVFRRAHSIIEEHLEEGAIRTKLERMVDEHLVQAEYGCHSAAVR